MKKTIFLAAILYASFINAQTTNDEKLTITKGTWVVGGGFSTNFGKSESDLQNGVRESKSFSVNISPKLGYAINSNLVAGLGVGYSYGKNKNTTTETPNDNSENISNSFSVFPYARAYKSLTRNLALYIQGEFKYTFTKNEYLQVQVLNGDSKRNDFFIGLRPGITYFLNKKIALEANLGVIGYRFGKTEALNGVEGNYGDFLFSMNADSFLEFGLSYYF